ncbi:MAG: hypothetical protein J5827_04560 [Oscillospiraceae bacterium]|nr:hypothetical protein [Oscillospiraceae bacterium]
MRKTNTAIKIAGFLFFAAALAYLVIYILQAVNEPFRTAVAVPYTVRDGAAASGIVIRDEEVLYSVYNTVYISAADGKRVTKNEEIAEAYNNTDDLHKAVRIGELDAQILQLEALTSEEASAEDMLRLDARIDSDILELRRSVYDRDLSGAEELALGLRTMAFTGTQSRDKVLGQLSELKKQRGELGDAGSLVTATVTAPASGLFSTAADGREDLDPSLLDNLSVSRLSELLREDPDEPEFALGKLVYGVKWYYAALVDQKDCRLLKKGQRVRVLFGRYYNESLYMTLESISSPENGKCAAVFSSERSLSDVLTLRRQDAELIFTEENGIRVPRRAMHVDDDGRTFVYVNTGLQAERKDVEIIRDMGDFYVVKSSRLKEGDRIIVSAKKLSDGKVVR